MKLLCIVDHEWELVSAGVLSAVSFPVYGNSYFSSSEEGEYCFIDECLAFFDKKYFIQVSDSDTTEVVNAKEEVYA